MTLQELIQQDRQRQDEFLRRRDDIRASIDAGIEYRRDAIEAGIEQGRAEDAVSDGDMDTNGDLIEPGRFRVTGWKTRDEEEGGERASSATPGEVGSVVASMLRSGFYQIVVDTPASGKETP